jgi:hypothetical protein
MLKGTGIIECRFEDETPPTAPPLCELSTSPLLTRIPLIIGVPLPSSNASRFDTYIGI